MEAKYKLTDETEVSYGHTVYRIEALRDFGAVCAGDKGGFIESEENLSHDGDAWVDENAKVSDNARVYGDAYVHGDARVYGHAYVGGRAGVSGDAEIWGEAQVVGFAYIESHEVIRGNAVVSGDADHLLFKIWWGERGYITWTRSNNKWSTEDFYGTGKELIKRGYAESEQDGKECERIVKYVESILADEKEESGK